MTLLEHIADCAKTVTAWQGLTSDEQRSWEDKEFKPYMSKMLIKLFDNTMSKDDLSHFMLKNCEISDLLDELEAYPEDEREKLLPTLKIAVEIRLREQLRDVSLAVLAKLRVTKGIEFDGMFMSLTDEYVKICMLFGIPFFPVNKNTKKIGTEPFTGVEDIEKAKEDPETIVIPSDYEAVLFLLPILKSPKFSKEFKEGNFTRYSLTINERLGEEYEDFIRDELLTYDYKIYRKKAGLSEEPNIIDYAEPTKDNDGKSEDEGKYLSKEDDTLDDVLRKLLAKSFFKQNDVLRIINRDKATFWLYGGNEQFTEINDFINPCADVEALRELIGKHTIMAQGNDVIVPDGLRLELSKLKTRREQEVAEKLIAETAAKARINEEKKTKQSLTTIISNAMEKAKSVTKMLDNRGKTHEEND
jgi:hypothetical protein